MEQPKDTSSSQQAPGTQTQNKNLKITTTHQPQLPLNTDMHPLGPLPPHLMPPPCMKKLDIYQFDLNGILGQGSSSTVYFGFNTVTHQPVCIKIVDYLALKSNEEKAQITNEIKCLKLFKTPQECKHILKLLDVLESKEFCYIVLEFCEAGDLFQLLHRKEVTEAQLIPIMRGVAHALAQLKAKGIVHRDLKPSNVMLKNVNGNLVPKLADFGFAALQQEVAKDSINMGSPLYMSPEVLLENKYSYSSEVFAFGILFFEVIHRVTPWESKTEAELITKIQDSNYQIQYKQNVSEGMRDLLGRCLKKNIEDRLTIQDICNHPVLKL